MSASNMFGEMFSGHTFLSSKVKKKLIMLNCKNILHFSCKLLY